MSQGEGTFFCIDGHTCGNPVRVVTGGAPVFHGATMSEKRQHLMRDYDWIRTGLMYEPRGHDVMSGTILVPPCREDCDIGVLFIEVSGCLPMCGHGTIGTVTAILERKLVAPKTEGVLSLDTPAGLVEAEYVLRDGMVEWVKIVNVPSFMFASGIAIDCPELGPLSVDVAYGGNFYAIIEAQENYRDMADLSPGDIQRLSPAVRDLVNATFDAVHPEDDTIRGVSHVMWTGAPTRKSATARNAVFYGDKAIDRSPCGTGTSARMAQLHARGALTADDRFIHESIIGSMFEGTIEDEGDIGGIITIRPGIRGWARIHGLNTIFIDRRDPFAHGFQVV
ncbi:MAG: 4-hydroxyproline epimerase [Minwuia sp.]|uniref:4-hydroxyproline epimerase n=1 Tax=Minwuia sp. TaxID=2493630 RepID=UPI003A895B09